MPGNRHDSRGWEESGAKAAVGTTMTIADGGYQGTGLLIPHRRAAGPPARANYLAGRSNITARTNGFAPASSTPSPA
ncbi:hypothetical protein GCM10009837_67860 [Streptomyces durmitorensis]